MACYNVSVIKVTPLKFERRTEMTDKAQAKIEELEAQKIIIEKVDEFLEKIERERAYTCTRSEIIYETDEEGNRIQREDGRDAYHWEERPYTDEEIAENPRIKAELAAWDKIEKALEKLI